MTIFNHIEPYRPKNRIRIVTASSLFDGHDVAINIMRRIIQASGCEVIHLGHNRSVSEIVQCAIHEDVQAIAITSYQGGHVEFLSYMYDLLKQKNVGHIKIFAGGGGVILPEEAEYLMKYGIARIYSPDDGRRMGLQGMINDLLQQSDFPVGNICEQAFQKLDTLEPSDQHSISRLISTLENFPELYGAYKDVIRSKAKESKSFVIGITGPGGAGKSSFIDELLLRLVHDFPDKKIAILSSDPTKRKTGGALLGDRIRMNSLSSSDLFMRSLATRGSLQSLPKNINDVLTIARAANFDYIILETSGIGQGTADITEYSDISLYIMTPEYGASTQLEKIDMIDFATIIVLNKADKKGAQDAIHDIRKQYKRSRQLWNAKDDELPIFATRASHFNDVGVNQCYAYLLKEIGKKLGCSLTSSVSLQKVSIHTHIIPPLRNQYLSEIADEVRKYNRWSDEQAIIAQKLYCLRETQQMIENGVNSFSLSQQLEQEYHAFEQKLHPDNRNVLENWEKLCQSYQGEYYSFRVRDKEIQIATHIESLSHSLIPKISLPRYKSWGDRLRWILQENVPGEFPYTAGVFPFKREGEEPTRMFAGEGCPERTNRRFHYVSKGSQAKRLSTAFDSVTLYGENPDIRPDIYGKVGNSGVSVASLDCAKKLYSGFRLTDPNTSVSMTINGPATILVGFFMNTAIDQECEIYIRQNGLLEQVNTQIDALYKKIGTVRPRYNGNLPEGHDGLGLLLLGVTGEQVLPQQVYQAICKDTLSKVRGTVQADILKEDQAQNTCIFSTEFSLKLMGDMQEYFIQHTIRNFYSVSISGYHIAEAGANPITQLAFTLANGFTFVEYYLSRGMKIDDFAPNFSFFFSNGMDPEYAVIGRVARRIWAKAMKLKYAANDRSQKLKYHIQTSGRSLHAQEIDFNDIRTTLQALYAIYDNCNSLHTNAYDEAVTTPTEESVRRAIAIQMIINHELGLTKNQNPLQGSFIIEELTDLVEEAVLKEFERISERGGVLGAMETNYQRMKIQDESQHYETMKHTGDLPIIGVNTFLSSKGSPTIIPREVIRSTSEEKQSQLKTLENLHHTYREKSQQYLLELQNSARTNHNIFVQVMEASKYCSLGQMTHALFDVGGQYRRNI